MRLYLVRHGETDWNKVRKLQGQVDIPLNEFGRELAKETKKGLADIPFAVCYTSPLKRAKETAELILEGRDVPIIEDERIMEMAFGVYEGKCCSKDGWELPDNFQKFFDDPVSYEAPEGGENFTDLKRRLSSFLSELYEKEEYKDSNILITTHGAALAGMLHVIRKDPLEKYWGIGVQKNCAVSQVEVENRVPRIISENVVYYKAKVEDWKR